MPAAHGTLENAQRQEPCLILLPERSIIALTGADRKAFLQGLITNDIHQLTPEKPLYALMLTPQGKFLYDMFLYEQGETLWLECAASTSAEFFKKLEMYKLRSKVTVSDVSATHKVAAWLNSRPEQYAIAGADPRNAALGIRGILPSDVLVSGKKTANAASYDALRISLGIPEGAKDMLSGDAFPLEFGMDKLNAISYTKGCYVGQEVTARTTHRGTLRKGIYRVTAKNGALPAYGTPITTGGKPLGTLLSSCGTEGLALLRTEEIPSDNLAEAGAASLTLHPTERN